MKKVKKISDASVRVLETLKLLSKENSSIQDILRYFEKIDPDSRIYTSEVILKYINTLKVFGFRFIKEKDKYVLLNYPNQINLAEKELKALMLIEKASMKFPEEKVKQEIQLFSQDLEKRFSDNTKLVEAKIKKPDFENLKLDYSQYENKIKEYEKYCLDKQRVKIIYKKNNRTEHSIIAEPNEINYSGNCVYFNVYNPSTAQIQNIHVDAIIRVEQLPLKSNPTNILTSVTFELKDRLARAYNLHDGEKLLQLKSNGNLIIMNQKEDHNLLIRRLMRYGENCEIIAPKSLREEMKELIKKTLKMYSE